MTKQNLMNECDISHRLRDLGDFPAPPQDIPDSGSEQEVVLGAGCFWCVEAVFKEIDGVLEVESGYAGGTEESADYRTVCSGTTNHAEVVRVRFDPARVTFGEILKVFFSAAHDPTQLNRQGNDRGTQYRSAIFYASDEQKRVAQAYIDLLNEQQIFGSDVVTTLEPLDGFYPAEEYHQNYAERNPDQPYIAAISAPKVQKLRSLYPSALKGDIPTS
ncbi:MAG: peptide-methionine (S)-S-oxide reductase MsrA [Xanthomonadales bacterium]|nr:peptide-methionine (S)-S-oxide reductase MsrA [Xanthomonadales bacterium]